MNQLHPGVGMDEDEIRDSSKNQKLMKKFNIFCQSFQNDKLIYYKDSLHRVNYLKPLILLIFMITLEYWKLMMSHPSQVINSEHMQRLPGLLVWVSRLHSHGEDC